MLASTKVFCAGSLLPALPFIVIFTLSLHDAPPIEALITVVPVTLEVSVVVHEPVPPDVVHVALLRLPGPLAMVERMGIPLDSCTWPVPDLAITCPVKVWVAPTALWAVSGLI